VGIPPFNAEHPRVLSMYAHCLLEVSYLLLCANVE